MIPSPISANVQRCCTQIVSEVLLSRRKPFTVNRRGPNSITRIVGAVHLENKMYGGTLKDTTTKGATVLPAKVDETRRVSAPGCAHRHGG